MAKEPTKTSDAPKTDAPKGDAAIPHHKLLAMGQRVNTGSGSGPKTPA